jgi:hypothetical protein
MDYPPLAIRVDGLLAPGLTHRAVGLNGNEHPPPVAAQHRVGPRPVAGVALEEVVGQVVGQEREPPETASRRWHGCAA